MKRTLSGVILGLTPFVLGTGFTAQFTDAALGRTVLIAVDGQTKSTFAGKLAFRTQSGVYMSVCGAVRKPIEAGRFYGMMTINTAECSEKVMRAGNIVGKFFNAAQTSEQAAGLQLAVWEALEDGGDVPNFSSGHFAAQAAPEVMAYAQAYYPAVKEPRNAAFLQSADGKSQSQIAPAPPSL